MSNALLVFIKNPEKGKVKTRLAKTLGDDQALRIYLALLEHTRRIALSLEVERYVFYSSFIEKNDAWLAADFHQQLQSSGDLGERMATAFGTAFKKNEKVVIIGSDCASLTPAIVQAAFEQLDVHDFVIGPAIDGGYYLLGMKTFEPSVFEGIEWSTETVLSSTIQQIENLQKRYVLLEELSDIDYQEDWEKYGWEM